MTPHPLPLREAPTVNDRPPNFREGDNLYLIRCYACGGERGRENYAPAVADGVCAFCGWKEGEEGDKP